MRVNKRGLTLVETLVVVAIVAVIVLVLMESLLGGLRLYRHGVSRSDLLQNARFVLDKIKSEIVSSADSLEVASSHPFFISDDKHNVLKVSSGGVDIYFGCYEGKKLPDGENVYVLGRSQGGNAPQPLTDAYDGGNDTYWVSVEEFKLSLLQGGNSIIYGLSGGGAAPDKGVYIYIRLSGPGGAEGKSFKKVKSFETSTLIYLRK